MTPYLTRQEVVGGRRHVEGQRDSQGGAHHPATWAGHLQLVSPDIKSVIIIGKPDSS